MKKEYLTLIEVSMKVGVSIQTLNNWYAFKRMRPDNEYAKMLPDYIQEGKGNRRLWKATDIEQIKKFKEVLPQGRGGILGCVTQRYENKRRNKK